MAHPVLEEQVIHTIKKLVLNQESSRFHSSLYRDEMRLLTSAYVYLKIYDLGLQQADLLN